MNKSRVLSLLVTIGVFATVLAVSRADVVVLDDQIVQGNQCVGNDCVDGEVFGLTTLRLKENNTRIFFHDTSTSSAFPKNDWEILVNDSSDGGESFMGFADRGENVANSSGAGYCDGSADDGMLCGLFGQSSCLGACNAGLSTGSPCIADSGCLGICMGGSEPPDTPCNDFIPCNQGGTCTNTGFCENPGTCDPFGGVIFKIVAGAPDDSLVIDSEGRLGVGFGNPSEQLHVDGNALIEGTLTADNVSLPSSRAYKHDIEGIDEAAALEVLDGLQPVHYRLNAQPEEAALGFIAEDVPEFVSDDERKTITPMKIITVLTRAVQAQQQLIEAQEQEAIRLEGRIVDLERALLGVEGGLAMIARTHITGSAITALIVATGVALVPGPIVADEIIADDLIVNGGSLCVGAGCVENQDFAFSTLTLQGEILRLQFDNTGRGATDWEIKVNASSVNRSVLNFLGIGPEKKAKVRPVPPIFSVIFRINAGGPEESVVIDSAGNLGLGTAAPTEQLHVVGNAIADEVLVTSVARRSSRTLKHDIQQLAPADALEAVNGLRPVTYQLNARPGETRFGFIAEEVPDLVASSERNSIEPMKIVAALTGAAQAQGEALERRQDHNAELVARLERLERALAARAD